MPAQRWFPSWGRSGRALTPECPPLGSRIFEGLGSSERHFGLRRRRSWLHDGVAGPRQRGGERTHPSGPGQDPLGSAPLGSQRLAPFPPGAPLADCASSGSHTKAAEQGAGNSKCSHPRWTESNLVGVCLSGCPEWIGTQRDGSLKMSSGITGGKGVAIRAEYFFLHSALDSPGAKSMVHPSSPVQSPERMKSLPKAEEKPALLLPPPYS